jgi:hypothetical protein
MKLEKCSWCDSKENLSRHHIIPRRIKKTLVKNMIVLCRDCHNIADRKTVVEKVSDDLYKITTPFGEFEYTTQKLKEEREQLQTRKRFKTYVAKKKKKNNATEECFIELLKAGKFSKIFKD